MASGATAVVVGTVVRVGIGVTRVSQDGEARRFAA